MAWTFRASNTGSVFSGSSVTVTKPSGTASGDLLIGCFTTYDQNSANFSTITRAGWTEIVTKTYSAGYYPKSHIFAKVADGSEPASYQFTLSPTTTNCAAAVLAYTPAVAADPAFNAVTATANDTTNAYTTPSVTCTADGSLVIRMGDGTTNPANFSTMTSHTRQINFNGGGGCALGVWDALDVSAGATGTYNYTANSGAVQITAAFAEASAGFVGWGIPIGIA